MTKWLVAVVACVSLSSVAPVPAQGADEKPKATPEEMFKRRDKDSDGFLSWEEFKGKLEGDKLAAADKQFKAKDTNSDMKLSLEEFKAKVKKAK